MANVKDSPRPVYIIMLSSKLQSACVDALLILTCTYPKLSVVGFLQDRIKQFVSGSTRNPLTFELILVLGKLFAFKAFLYIFANVCPISDFSWLNKKWFRSGILFL